MKQVVIRKGEVVVEDIPIPQLEAGRVLIRVHCSCISAGTELSGIEHESLPLWRRALKEPQKVLQAMQMAATEGPLKTYQAITNSVSEDRAMGYSVSGEIVQCGAGVDRFKVGMRVAAAGAQCAHHAEYVSVPTNLCVAIPDGVEDAEASTVTLGAIAMQGLRRLEPSLGERFAVVGMGFLGQLTCQLLKASGCKVIAIEPLKERADLSLAASAADFALNPSDEKFKQSILDYTQGYGVDGVVVTAASPSHEILSTAFQICRKKARVVLVGDVGLNIQRSDIYVKELDFRVSTSYGPGRYDRRFEEEGLDYPISHVRWTETRNMQAYLELLASKRISVDAFIQNRYPVEKASVAYSDISEKKLFTALLSYPHQSSFELRNTKRVFSKTLVSDEKTIGIGLIGPGAFTQAVHIPNLKKMNDAFKIVGSCSRSGLKASNTAKMNNAHFATTSPDELIQDPSVAAVLISTRHDSHATLTAKALKANKHVLVEKPLAMNRTELTMIRSELEGTSQNPVLFTGFNRRFSPAVAEIRNRIGDRKEPLVIQYMMNAGFLEKEHWIFGPEGGGRNIGEACHIYDLFISLTGSQPRSIQVQRVDTDNGLRFESNDNFSVNIGFEDGSIANLIYTSAGNGSWPKEQMELYSSGDVFKLSDYRELLLNGKTIWKSRYSDKGHFCELQAFYKAIRTGSQELMPVEEQILAMDIAFEVEDALGNAS